METPNKFEEQWRSAFEDAEMPPNPAVWDKVELAIANSANTKFKRRILFFKLMAAASVAFALTVAGVGLYQNMTFEDSSVIAEKNPETADSKPSIESDVERSESLQEQAQRSSARAESNQSFQKGGDQENMDRSNEQQIDGLTNNNAADAAKSRILAAKDNDNGIEPAHISSIDDQSERSTKGTAQPSDRQRLVTADIPEKLDKRMAALESFSFSDPDLRMVPWYGAVVKEKKRTDKELWAGLGMLGGGFDPAGGVSSESNPNDATFSLTENSFSEFPQAPVIGKEENGRTINIGLNFGMRIAPRWIIQSGLVLIDRSTTNTSNVAEFTGSALRAVNDLNELSNSANINVIGAYEIDNSYRFISVPVQAGYALVDKKFALTILGGVSNDLFIRKTVEGDLENFEEFNSNEGIDRYNLTGLLGTEFGYHLGEHYLIALTPQIRQSISTTTISGETVRPTFFEFGFRFKYLLK